MESKIKPTIYNFWYQYVLHMKIVMICIFFLFFFFTITNTQNWFVFMSKYMEFRILYKI
jgi:hypothetical protein